MKLSAKAVEQTQPTDKEYLLSDGDKLYLRVKPQGSKSWQFIYYNAAGKRIKLTLGAYPTISLASARELAAEQRRHLAMGKDPFVQKLENRQETRRQALATLENVAREWHAHAKDVHEWSEDYANKILRQLELHAFPKLGKHPIGSLNQMWVPTDFAQLGSRDAVDKALQRLVATGQLRRIDRGYTTVPRRTA